MTNKPSVWPALRYQDPIAAMAFLKAALGFTEAACFKSESGVVEHAQLSWPNGGGVMLGQARDDSVISDLPAGVGAVYLVAPDPDALHDQAVAAGANVVMGLTDQDYGSRDFTIRDPEGVYWSVGTYGGE